MKETEECPEELVTFKINNTGHSIRTNKQDAYLYQLEMVMQE